MERAAKALGKTVEEDRSMLLLKNASLVTMP